MRKIKKKAAKQIAKRAVKRASKKKAPVAKKSKAVKKPAGLTMAEGWRSVFVDNEKAKKPDAELIKKMERLFPDSAGKSTITRVSMARCCYNKGSAMFANLGPASRKSHRFVDGVKKEPNSKPAAKKKATKKKAVKKKPVKKRAAKRKAGSKS